VLSSCRCDRPEFLRNPGQFLLVEQYPTKDGTQLVLYRISLLVFFRQRAPYLLDESYDFLIATLALVSDEANLFAGKVEFC